MKDYHRKNHEFSLCGLACNLCVMYLGKYCPGCGNGNQSCRLKRCAIDHGKLEFCNQCHEFPCYKYEGRDEYDSFITIRNRYKDFEQLSELGETVFITKLKQKANILKYLLDNYNDGRKKTFYCLAVNLLDLKDLQIVMEQIDEVILESDSLKIKAAKCVDCFNEMAKQRNIVLKLNKKKKEKK